MRFSSIFRLGTRLRYARTGSDSLSRKLPIASDSPGQPPAGSEPNQACPSSPEPIRAETVVFKFDRWFLPGERTLARQSKKMNSTLHKLEHVQIQDDTVPSQQTEGGPSRREVLQRHVSRFTLQALSIYSYLQLSTPIYTKNRASWYKAKHRSAMIPIIAHAMRAQKRFQTCAHSISES